MPVIIGRIEGDDLAVKTTTTAGIEIDAGPTVVASGSDVTVRSGHARILLDSGGEISICGPAHFTLVNSTGAITLALDYGRVHPSLSSSETFTIYTPSVVATPVGGIPDLICSGENGLLVSPGDIDGLARAIVSLLTNPALSADIGKAGFAYIEHFHSIDHVCTLLHGIYASLGIKPASESDHAVSASRS